MARLPHFNEAHFNKAQFDKAQFFDAEATPAEDLAALDERLADMAIKYLRRARGLEFEIGREGDLWRLSAIDHTSGERWIMRDDLLYDAVCELADCLERDADASRSG